MYKVALESLLLITVIFINVLVAQENSAGAAVKTQSDSAKVKAEQILKHAREAISKKIKVEDIKSLLINIKSSEQFVVPTRQNQVIQGNIETEFGLILPDKIRQNFSGDYTTNQSTSILVLNGDRFSRKTNVTVGGEPVNVDIDNIDSKEQNIARLKYDTFINIFPVILDATYYAPLEFRYTGATESKDIRAEILEAHTRNGAKYNLFFDAKTYLLLMMTESWTNKENKSFENKYFYSDYQEKGGLLVATKIIVEKNGKVVEEKTIKDLKVNTTFTSNFFDVK